MTTDTMILMGPSACGKSTVGRLVADLWAAGFVEGDEYHSPDNVAKMASGRALTDADRVPWIAAIGSAVERSSRDRVVLACSALNAGVRHELSARLPGPCGYVLLDVPAEVLAKRLATRTGHFVGPSLLESQLASLTPPASVVRVDGMLPPDEAARAAVAAAARPGFFA